MVAVLLIVIRVFAVFSTLHAPSPVTFTVTIAKPLDISFGPGIYSGAAVPTPFVGLNVPSPAVSQTIVA